MQFNFLWVVASKINKVILLHCIIVDLCDTYLKAWCCLWLVLSVAVFQYLTTVIPYHPNHGPPSIEQLQIYIKSKYLQVQHIKELSTIMIRREQVCWYLFFLFFYKTFLWFSVWVKLILNSPSPSHPYDDSIWLC